MTDNTTDGYKNVNLIKNFRGLGAIVLPSNRFGDKIHPLVKWTDFQTRYPTDKEIKEHDELLKHCEYIQIVCGTLYSPLNYKPTRKKIVGYDLDNKPAINEFTNYKDKQYTLEEFANKPGVLVDINPDKPDSSAHVYFVVEGDIEDDELIPEGGKDDKNVPMIEIMATSKSLMVIRKLIGNNPAQFFNNLTSFPSEELKQHINNIREKYKDQYQYNTDNTKNKAYRVLIDTTGGKAYEGIRTNALHAHTCYKIRTLYDTTPPEEIKKDIEDTNQKRCIPPLPANQVEIIWKSALDFISRQIQIEVSNGNGKKNKTNDEKYDELKGNIYYQINEKPPKYIIAYRQKNQIIEVTIKTEQNKSGENPLSLRKYIVHNKTYLACIPVKIIRHRNPLAFFENSEKYSMTFVDSIGEKHTWTHKTLAEISQLLKDSGYALSDGIDQALSAMILAFKENKLIEENEEIAETGFFLDREGNLIVNNIDIVEPDKQKLIDAIMLLSELKAKYEGRLDLLAHSIKWGMVAPINFILKTNNWFLKWFHFYGFPNATKSNTGKIILALDGHHTDATYTKNNSRFDSIARIGDAISKSTFPILIDEINLTDEKIIDVIKSAIEQRIFRSKFMQSKAAGTSDIPSLSPAIFTSNTPPPFNNGGLMRRTITRSFPKSESRKEDDPESIAFRKFMELNLPRLKALGDFRNWYIVNHKEEILDDKKPEPLDLGLDILKKAFEYTGINIPVWLIEERLPENQLEESLQDADTIVKRTVEKYIDEQLKNAVYIWKAEQSRDQDQGIEIPTLVSEKIKRLVESNFLQDIKYSARIDKYLIGSGILKELCDRGVTKDQLPNLRALADYIGGEFVKIHNNVVKVSLEQLKEYFDKVEDGLESQGSQGSLFPGIYQVQKNEQN